MYETTVYGIQSLKFCLLEYNRIKPTLI